MNVELVTGPHGPGLKYQGTLLNDPERPWEEARESVEKLVTKDPAVVFVFGMGLGYHLVTLTEKWPDATIYAFESDPDIRAACLNHWNESGFRPPEHLTVIDGWEQFNEIVYREIVHGGNDNAAAMISPGYKEVMPDESKAFESAIQGARLRRVVVDRTREEKRPLIRQNLVRNLADITRLPVITNLKDRYPGCPGFIVGSGPGLEKNAKYLRQLMSQGLVLAAGSALKPLLNIDVVPDVVVIIEPEDTSAYLETRRDLGDCVLALGSSSHPNHFRATGFNKAVFHLNQGERMLFNAETILPQGGTSGTAAFSLGLILGLSPLVLVGHDQAAGKDALHAAGTPGEVTLTYDLTAYSVPGVEGRPVHTHSGLVASLHWFNEAVQYMRRHYPDRTVLNATESGAHIPGVQDVTFQQVVLSMPVSFQPPPDLWSQLKDLPRPDCTEILRDLEQAVSIATQLEEIARRAPDRVRPLWTECRELHALLNDFLPDEKDLDDTDLIRRLADVEGSLLTMMEVLS
jgi:hypothetical protein